MTLPGFSSWVPMATPAGPYHSSLSPPHFFLSQAALVSIHSQTIPYISTKPSGALFLLSALRLCPCHAPACVFVHWEGKAELDLWRQTVLGGRSFKHLNKAHVSWNSLISLMQQVEKKTAVRNIVTTRSCEEFRLHVFWSEVCRSQIMINRTPI